MRRLLTSVLVSVSLVVIFTSPPGKNALATPAPKPAPAAAKAANPVSRSENSDARLVVNTAYDLLGSNYVYGSAGPSNFDCSGFTRYVYKKIGYDLPHLASGQYDHGVKVSRNQLAPGDLLFFSYYGRPGIDHVGIYVGNGTFIHASSSKKKVVATSMNDSYYVENYKGATRLIR
ncbi:C40 family peptidase [Desulfotruncus alcoholivorax]|uniref:C40 family peptidase n=1 Tax=Desulfotruncus alcoholivorax TaxID=265477 RepID=UPI000414EAE6|nr:C40 family peptidase [Desulfotruncus alcoholivorax]